MKKTSPFSMQWAELELYDPEIAATFKKESFRLQEGLELIASENVASPAVLAALSSVFTNKYAEGYPGRRYYGGCQWVDEAEEIAQRRAQKLFGAEHVNVQPHSGAQANQAVFMALLKPGDTFLGMSLAHGGHLTHGSPVNLSGQYYTAHAYGTNDKGLLDFDQIRSKAHAVRPKLIIAGGSAYPRTIDFAAFRSIADEVGALLMVDMAHIAGLVAAGAHPSPIPHAHVVTTTTHKTLRGPRGGLILCQSDFAKAIDKAVFPGIQGGPLMHIIAAKAVAFREALEPSFQEYGRLVVANACSLAHHLSELGHVLVSGGTDNHLMLMDLTSTPLSGKEAEELLAEAHITVNKNSVPNDPRSPMVTSGIRLGTPAITTRGLTEDHMPLLAQAIAWALQGNPSSLSQARSTVSQLCQQFPLYQGVVAQKGYLAPPAHPMGG